MVDEKYVEQLESVLAQMLQPVRGVPFSIVVKALANTEVFAFDPHATADRRLLADVEAAMLSAGQEIRRHPILRPRPNEVGNDIEPFVMAALTASGLACSRPVGTSGAGKSAGYPDLVFQDHSGRTVYLECKSLAANSSRLLKKGLVLAAGR